jgi:hypothetical protein
MDGDAVIVIPLALLLLAGAGYLIRRRLEGRKESETAKAILDWIEIHKAIYGTAPTIYEVQKTREAFLRRNAVLDEQPISPEALAAVAEKEKPEPPPEWMFFGYELSEWEKEQADEDVGIWPQLKLNERAQHSFKLVENHLAAELIRWDLFLREDEKPYFELSQSTWRDFRDAQATFAASEYKGGTIAPMIYWGEMFEKTQQRLTELERDRRGRDSII